MAKNANDIPKFWHLFLELFCAEAAPQGTVVTLTQGQKMALDIITFVLNWLATPRT